MLLLLLALTAGPPDAALPPGPAIPPARDCALYDLIHREQLSRRADTDDGIQLRVSPTGTGLASHLVCPGWRIAGRAPSEVIVFEPPAFSRSGGRARVGYTVLYFNHHWDVRRVTDRATHSCLLERKAAGWRVTSCRESPATQ